MAESLSATQTKAESSKRASFEHSRRPSVESLKRASVEIVKRLSNPKQEVGTCEHAADKSEEKGELPISYIQSKFNRTGSVNYRNAGWKSSQKRIGRTDSSSSTKSNVSNEAKVDSHEVLQMSPQQQQAYVQQKFIDITNILKDAGIDEDILQSLKI